MGVVFLYGNGGGGGGGLNFRIISGTVQPTSAKENDIWVNTDKIESYVFSATEPEAPAAGMVWIEVGFASPVVFNALKKNTVYVYPVFCKQYANGAWEDRFAHIYQGGEWVQFSEVITAVYIIKDGYVDFEQYPYTYVYQHWGINSVETKSGGVESSAIKVSQTYNDKPALWTKSSNGYYWKNTFDNVTVPKSASVFKFEYYLLGSEGKNPTITIGDATATIDRGGNKNVTNGTVEIDVTSLRGQTVKFTYTTHGGANNYENYVGNAWFE